MYYVLKIIRLDVFKFIISEYIILTILTLYLYSNIIVIVKLLVINQLQK